MTDKMITALTTCIDKMKIRLSTCSARLSDDTLNRLIDSILKNQEYMHPLNEQVPFSFQKV
jgi:hypothetical protein